MKNKYLFDANKETLLKNTELDIAEAKKIPADQLSDYSNSVSECDEIMEERKKDESNYMERMKEFLQKLFATKDNGDLHSEIKKMYRKLYHAIAYQEDAINKMNESAEIMGQICADLCVIYRKWETIKAYQRIISLIRLFITEIDHLKMAYIVQYPLICNLEFGINHLM